MKKQVIAYLHTHWDREWYKTYEEFSLRLIQVFDEVLDELKNNKAPCFYFDGQVGALQTYLKFRPEKTSVVKKLIKEKKLFIGPFFVSADSFLTGGWSLIKNLEIGLKYSKEFGENDFIGYLSDTFGHSKGIFDIFKYYNIKNTILWRGIGDIEADFILNDIETTRLVRGYFMDALHTGNVELLEKTLNAIDKYSNDLILLPIGADHLKILSNANEKIDEVNKKLKNFEIKLSSPFEYIEKIKPKKKIQGEMLDNSSTYILQGVYSTRTYQKIKNSKLEWELGRLVEPFDLVNGNKFSSEISYAYNLLIKNHAHDSLYGCSIDEVHKEVDMRFNKVSQILTGIKERIIEEKVKNSKGKYDKIMSYNFSNYNYSGLCEIITDKKIKNAQLLSKTMGFEREKLYEISQIPITEDYKPIYKYLVQTPDLKPFSSNVFDLALIESDLITGDGFIENGNIKLFIKDKKVCLLNKKHNKTYENFIEITDTEDEGDSYNFSPKNKPLILDLINSKVQTKGKLRSVLRLFYQSIKLDVVLENNSEQIKFIAHINNKKKNHKLQVRFNFDKNVSKTIAEDTIGIIEREHDYNYSLCDNLPIEFPKEAKTNFYPMSRFVYFNGTGIMTLGLREYEVYKNSISISLLRATGLISNPKNPARRISAGPPLPIPEAQCLGVYDAEFGICFTDKIQNVYKETEKFYNPTIGFIVKGDKNKETIFFNSQNNKILYGFKDKNTAVFYDLDKNKIEDIKN